MTAGKHGGDRGNQYTGGKIANGKLDKRPVGTNQKSYLLRRLHNQHPDIYRDLLDKKYPSVRQAAITVEIVRVKPWPELWVNSLKTTNPNTGGMRQSVLSRQVGRKTGNLFTDIILFFRLALY